MKPITRIWTAALALCCVLPFAACGKQENIPANTQAVTTEKAAELPDIPLHADYGQAEFRVLSAGNDTYADFVYEEESSLPLENAQYKRKKTVEQNYNVQISEDVKTEYSSGGGPGCLAVTRQVNSGDCDYDLCLIAGYDVSVLAYGGYLYDLNSLPGVDLSRDWWDQKANASLTSRGVLFFTAGEITVADNNAAFCIMFNKQLTQDYSLESPYDLVKDNRWTIENFGKLCKTVTEDVDQNNVMDENDRYGLLVWDDSVLGIVNAAGQQCCSFNDEGKLELTLYNETTLAALEQYFNIAYDTQYALTYQRTSAVDKDLWSGNHGLFWTTHMKLIPSFREMESDFGILPYPKLTETQDSYYSTISPYNSQFICVPLIQNDAERTGVLTEALAYYGKEIITPAYYDVSLVGMSTRDEESSEMLDIIFDSLVYDIGYFYQIGPYNKNLIYMMREYDRNFTSRYETFQTRAQNMLDVINEEYAAAVAEWQ